MQSEIGALSYIQRNATSIQGAEDCVCIHQRLATPHTHTHTRSEITYLWELHGSWLAYVLPLWNYCCLLTWHFYALMEHTHTHVHTQLCRYHSMISLNLVVGLHKMFHVLKKKEWGGGTIIMIHEVFVSTRVWLGWVPVPHTHTHTLSCTRIVNWTELSCRACVRN